MKNLIKAALSRAGIYYAKRRYMPSGIDWLWDVHRLIRGRRLETVFDVGANVGQTTLSIKGRFPDARVHAFEPVDSTFTTLQRNVQGLDGVTVHRLALSDRVGSAVITAQANSQLNHFVSGVTEESEGTERVHTDTLDAFCARQQIDWIDLLKVDAEGADLQVLRGGDRLFRDGRIAFVFVEAGFVPTDSGHVYLPALLEYLTSAGAEPYAFYDYWHRPSPEHGGQCGLVFANVLFVCPAARAQLR